MWQSPIGNLLGQLEQLNQSINLFKLLAVLRRLIMKKVVKVSVMLAFVAVAVAFAPKIKIQVVEDTAAACDMSTGAGCD